MERKEFDQPMRKCQQYLGQFLDVLDIKKPVANVALNTSLFLGHEKETQHSPSLALEASNKENDFLKKINYKKIYISIKTRLHWRFFAAIFAAISSAIFYK